MTEAFTILGYYEHLTGDDIPPENIWGNDDALEAWFEDIKIRRGNADSSMERVPDPPQGMTSNALVDELKMGAQRRRGN